MTSKVPGMFLLLFAGLGLWSSIDLYQSGDLRGGTTSLVLGLVLLSASVWAILLASKRAKNGINQKPWLDRSDWASGRIPARGNHPNVIAIGVIGVAFLVAAVCLFKTTSADADIGVLKWLALFFGSVFCGGSVYTRNLRNRFGKSFFTMDEIPGVMGSNLKGTLVVTKALQPAIETLHLKLHVVKVESRRDDDSVERSLWESPVMLSRNQTEAGISRIPVQLPIPTHLPQSGNMGVLWKLEAYAKMDGLDYSVDFEVPVFAVDLTRIPEN